MDKLLNNLLRVLEIQTHLYKVLIDKSDLYFGSISYDSEGYGIIRADSSGNYSLVPEIWNAVMESHFSFDIEYFSDMPSTTNPNPQYEDVAILDYLRPEIDMVDY